MKVTEERRHERPDASIEPEVIADAVDDVLGMELGRSTRADIDRQTVRVLVHLNLLLSGRLQATRDEEVRALIRVTFRLLDLAKRPTHDTPAFEAFAYAQQVAACTRDALAYWWGGKGTVGG
ncbi:hypothetical protein [Streptomyces sp. NPDC088923]|uniref:hypothetical protein n=1 Tax=Streptomyces sp. NPDC088923 TaxID=3365913 RepID=UPI0038173B05